MVRAQHRSAVGALDGELAERTLADRQGQGAGRCLQRRRVLAPGEQRPPAPLDVEDQFTIDHHDEGARLASRLMASPAAFDRLPARPRQRRAVGVGGVAGRQDQRGQDGASGFPQRAHARAKAVDCAGRAELRRTQPFDEVAATNPTGLLGRGQDAVDAGETARDVFRTNRPAGQDAIAVQEHLGPRVCRDRRVALAARKQRPSAHDICSGRCEPPGPPERTSEASRPADTAADANCAAGTGPALATDGAPNCNASSNCGVDRCVPNLTKAAAECTPTNNCCKAPTYSPGNCIDEDAVPAVKALRSAGVPTFVLGIPGSEVFGDVLDDMAVAGDTVQPGSVTKYYKVGATGPNAIATALRKIAARVVGNCTITLEKTPADPEQVNVFFDGAVVPRDGDNGWRLTDNVLTLIGVSCQQVQQGDVLEVRVVAGCPTVTIGK